MSGYILALASNLGGSLCKFSMQKCVTSVRFMPLFVHRVDRLSDVDTSILGLILYRCVAGR